jgi:hypothetical protein
MLPLEAKTWFTIAGRSSGASLAVSAEVQVPCPGPVNPKSHPAYGIGCTLRHVTPGGLLQSNRRFLCG